MSNMRTSIKCNCGQRILSKDVVQHGYYLRLFGPSFVYVKFRCSRCKKLGEQFIKQEEWEEGILKDAPLEVSTEEREQFAAQGPIDINEVLDFHFQLENLGDLKALESAPPTAQTPDALDAAAVTAVLEINTPEGHPSGVFLCLGRKTFLEKRTKAHG